ncbi:efflux RND transporter permease subunit [Chitinilyticum piscinae]|uniref:Efflux RND transporter permease subunit n=1 Tax=Chitinilyticum piscinae TaxID=2866724 RepID=A0A8J7FLX0_9NEIS|nr:efflux RND transporter permease subunit [Chitinilyticum piscinae]MBE9610502.1 efflux RND transporter permease subunit [Chitinilyticum piscinae]
MWFTEVSLKNPVFATMMMLSLFVLGLFSLQRLPVEEFPDVKFPVVFVQTSYPGAGPEVVESEVTRKVEEAMNTVGGLTQLYSHSYEGVSVVIAEFDLSVDPTKAVQDVREKMAGVTPLLRREVETPVIQRYDPTARPIVSLAISSDRLGARELTTRSEQLIKKRYETVRGVGRVELIGGRSRAVEVQLKPAELAARQLTATDIINTIKLENAELPVGTLEYQQQERLVQIRGRLKTPTDFGNLVVAQRQGSPVYLRDVASVRDGQAEQESLALVNGKPALSLDIVKIDGANTVQVSDDVRAMTDELNNALATEGIRITVLNDTSTGIRNSLKDVRTTMLEGAALTVLIVFLFLGSWRSTVITGLTLPVALIGAFWVLSLAGFTINVMTMMALSLCVGLLIDDAIVVRENIVRHAAMGKSHFQAALDGTREIGLAVLATTSTIVAVFLPVGFMGGIIGQFFHQFGLTVCAAVLISMFVSFTLDPMLSSVWPDPHVHGGKRPLGRLLDWFEDGMDKAGKLYSRVIAWSLAHRKSVLAIGLGSLVAAFMLARFIGSEFVPKSDLSRLAINYSVPVGSALDYTAEKTRQIDAAMREFPEVIQTYATLNAGEGGSKHDGRLTLILKPRKERERSQAELIPLLRERLSRIAGVTISDISSLGGGGPDQKPIAISLQGSDLKELERLSLDFADKLARIPGVVDVESTQKPGKPALNVEIDRPLAADLGLSLTSIGNALRPLVAGEKATTWQAPDGENYDVIVRLPADARQTGNQLESIYLPSSRTDANGKPVLVPLSSVAELKSNVSPVQVNRRAMQREVWITANASGRTTGEIQADIQKLKNSFKLPPGYRFDEQGDAKDMAESASYAVAALALGVIFIYMILASQFGSFLQPLAIMTSLPLSIIGVLLALLLWRSTMNIFSVIGIIMLMGLVTKNAILLVDFVNHLRQQGYQRAAAIAEAGRVRLRPILMTTAAMVVGMLPLALAIGEGAEARAPMAHAIIGGLITSTLLTLVVVPVVFTYLDDLGCWLLRRWRKDSSVPRVS